MSETESKLFGVKTDLRSGRSTTEQIMTLLFLLSAARTQKRSPTVVFADYSKACDSVDRRAIPVILRNYGVSGQVVDDVMMLCHGPSAAVSTSYRLTETFDTTNGVLHGDIPSPNILSC